MTAPTITRDTIALSADDVLLICQKWADGPLIQEAQSGTQMTYGDVLSMVTGMDNILRVAKTAVDLSEPIYPLEADLAGFWISDHWDDFGETIHSADDVPAWVARVYTSREIDRWIAEAKREARIYAREVRELSDLKLAGRV